MEKNQKIKIALHACKTANCVKLKRIYIVLKCYWLLIWFIDVFGQTVCFSAIAILITKMLMVRFTTESINSNIIMVAFLGAYTARLTHLSS